MRKMINCNVKRLCVGAGLAGGALSASAQTNTVASVSSALTGALGTSYDTAISIGALAVGIGLVVYLIRKGVKVRG